MYEKNSKLIDSYTDIATGLKNKNYRNYLLPEIILNNGNNEYSVLLIDLNDFKTLNDVQGYYFGDKVLNEVGKRLSAGSGSEDIVIYSGSDRFIVIRFKEENIDNYAEKILSDLREKMIIEDTQANLTSCIGIYTTTKDENISTALQNADIALNYAKKQGKDGYSIFNILMKEKVLRKSKIQERLKEAIKNDWLEVYYQPKIDLKDEKLIGTEALLRWNDEKFGTISPGEFIPIAEETGIIIELGRYVLKKVFTQIKTWEESRVNYINVAVNVSVKQFRDISLPKFISNLLKEYELSPSVLEMEVTESAIKYGDKMLYEFIKKDIKIAIDDFGTGYSSYNRLSSLGLNILKIDKSFIDFINCDLRKNLIVKNIIELAHILDMKVVAEGVEQEHQMKTLKEYGCDIIQGYYYSKPLCVGDFQKYIIKKGEC
jgi:diguanylate cyclase (GGDEF)-like protein